MSVPTPHISANLNDFAETVLMPGDPKRSKFIADTFLTDVKLVNDVRGVQGYTGKYNGKLVSVMASGMGMPSMGIYSHELFNYYNVKNIIRIGTAGALNNSLKIGDVIICNEAVTNANFSESLGLKKIRNIKPSLELIDKAKTKAQKLNKKCIEGKLFTSLAFYTSINQLEYAKDNILAVEMETFALYLTAKQAGKNAVSICTISDNLVTKESADAIARQNNFMDMVKIALEVATMGE